MIKALPVDSNFEKSWQDRSHVAKVVHRGRSWKFHRRRASFLHRERLFKIYRISLHSDKRLPFGFCLIPDTPIRWLFDRSLFFVWAWGGSVRFGVRRPFDGRFFLVRAWSRFIGFRVGRFFDRRLFLVGTWGGLVGFRVWNHFGRTGWRRVLKNIMNKLK